MFEAGGNTAVLEFGGGTALDGAEVRVSLDMSVRDFLALQRTIAGIGNDRESITEGQLAAIEGAFREFGEHGLMSWDLGLNGEALPPDGEGMMRLPFRHANTIFSAWARALSDVSPNLSAVSANGASAEAGSALTAA